MQKVDLYCLYLAKNVINLRFQIFSIKLCCFIMFINIVLLLFLETCMNIYIYDQIFCQL